MTEYRKLPHGTEMIGTLGLGMGGIQSAPPEEIEAVVSQAVENGINFFDLCAGGGERRLPCPCAARHLNPLSIVVANRLLSRSVIRKIERPLDELLAGAREVASGNLGYRIYEIFR